MKKMVFFTLLLLISYQGSAQQELIGEHWKLHYMIIDGITYDVPQPHPGNFEYRPGIEFYGSSPSDYEVYAFIYFNDYTDSEPPTAIDATTFTVQSPSVTLGECFPYCELESQYFGYILSGDEAPRTFNYEIINESNGDRTMIITTPEGDIAVHGDHILSANEFDKEIISFYLYPNPASDKLKISSENSVIEQIKIYSLLGELIIEQKYDEIHSIDVSRLSKGIYLIEAGSDKGSSIQKFIKE